MTKSKDELDPEGASSPAILSQVRAYWEALRQDGDLPFRSDINPRGIEHALSSTFLIERVAPGVARFRIAGMDYSDLMGMDVRGLPLSAVFVPEARAALASKLEQVFHSPAIMELTLESGSGLLKPALGAQMLVMPVRDATGQTKLALGCMVLKGKIGRSPRRFEISKTLVSPLHNIAAAAARAPKVTGFAPRVILNEQAPAFAEPQASFVAQNTDQTTARPTYLRLVD
jgi:hypothetical protein